VRGAKSGAPPAAFDVVGHGTISVDTGPRRLTGRIRAANLAPSGPSYSPLGSLRKALVWMGEWRMAK
jgi:hypothetical protein